MSSYANPIFHCGSMCTSHSSRESRYCLHIFSFSADHLWSSEFRQGQSCFGCYSSRSGLLFCHDFLFLFFWLFPSSLYDMLHSMQFDLRRSWQNVKHNYLHSKFLFSPPKLSGLSKICHFISYTDDHGHFISTFSS